MKKIYRFVFAAALVFLVFGACAGAAAAADASANSADAVSGFPIGSPIQGWIYTQSGVSPADFQAHTQYSMSVMEGEKAVCNSASSDFSVNPDSVGKLVGPSGAGKTTILRSALSRPGFSVESQVSGIKRFQPYKPLSRSLQEVSAAGEEGTGGFQVGTEVRDIAAELRGTSFSAL